MAVASTPTIDTIRAARERLGDRVRETPVWQWRGDAIARTAGAGTLPTHRPLFVALLTGVALVVVGLTYVPALALGPIAESLS